MDYAKRAEDIVELRNPDGEEPHGPSTWIFDHWIDTCEDPKVTAATLREKVAAELQAAHDAGVVEERARWTPIAMAAREALAKYAHDTGYGLFIGGDPRRFTPDEGSTTPEEMAAWKAACAEAEANEKARDLESPCGLETVEHEGRNVPAFVDRAPFGLGTYECGDEEAEAACEAITALLGDGSGS